MSTEWTAERLDALPEGTVIEWVVPGGRGLRFVKGQGIQPWVYLHGGRETSESLLRSMCDLAGEGIRVVSVPIDALLAEQTAEALDNAEGWCRLTDILRAAVAHVTGEAR